jgi:hypothetical protein
MYCKVPLLGTRALHLLGTRALHLLGIRELHLLRTRALRGQVAPGVQLHGLCHTHTHTHTQTHAHLGHGQDAHDGGRREPAPVGRDATKGRHHPPLRHTGLNRDLL